MRWTRGGAVLATVMACRGEHPTTTARDAATAPAVTAPTAPEGLLGRVRLARPRATAEALGERLGMRVPIDLLLAMGAGVPMAVLGAADTTRPVAACALDAGEHGALWVLALTPRSAAEARAALSARYRMVTVAGLGERAEAREGGASEGVSCALVAVPDATAARVVCASDAATLGRAGRWLAWTLAGASEGDDVEATLAEGAAPRLRAQWTTATTGLLTDWSAAASAARREHDRPPDYGDPEAALVVLTRARDAVGAAIGEVRALRVGARLTEAGVALTVTATLPRAGASAVAADAVARAGAGTGASAGLSRWVAPDANIHGWVNTPGEGHRVLWRSLVGAAMEVLGARVAEGAAARRTLEALGRESGEVAALGGVTGGTAGVGDEWTLVVAQRDGGRSARAALGQLASAGWVRALRWGGRSVRVVGCGTGAWCATVTEGAAGGAGGAGGARGTVVLAVRDGALVVIAGARARATLDGADARGRVSGDAGAGMGTAVGNGNADGDGDGGGAREAESAVVTVRGTGGARQEGARQEGARQEGARQEGARQEGAARVGYGAALVDGETVRVTGRVEVPWWVVEAVARRRGG